MARLQRSNSGEERDRWHRLSVNEVVSTVFTATNAAVELQEEDNSHTAALQTHQRLRRAYAEGAKALSGKAPSDELSASLLNGYIEHAQEVVKLQSKVRQVVFSNSDMSAQNERGLTYFTSKPESEAEYEQWMRWHTQDFVQSLGEDEE